MQARLKDPDLARLFANTFPSTLDTTVKYFDPDLNLAFIITGVCAAFPWFHPCPRGGRVPCAGRRRGMDIPELTHGDSPAARSRTLRTYPAWLPSPRVRPAPPVRLETNGTSAQWLRDTGNQFAHLYKLLPQDENLAALVKAVINTEARYIAEYPYCGQ